MSRFFPPTYRCASSFFSGRLNSFQRVGMAKRCQTRGYSRSSRLGNEHVKEAGSSSSSRSLGSFAIPAALLGVAGVAAYVRYNDERRSVAKGEGARGGTTVKGPTIGGPFTLINTEGQQITEQDLLGNWVLFYFGYTSSPDIGPEEVQKMAKTVDILESIQNLKLIPVFVTIDPQRDTPLQLKAYLREFDPRIVGLTGHANSVRQMAQEYRVFFKKVEEDGNDYLVDSSHNMYLMNPSMEIVRCFGVEYNTADLVEAIAKEVMKVTT